MNYLDFEETILKNIFKHKEEMKDNEVYKRLQDEIVKQVTKLSNSLIENDDLKKLLHLMEVKSEILLIKIYLDAINDFEDLEKVISIEEIKKYVQDFNLVEIYNEIFVDDYKNETNYKKSSKKT